MKFGRTIGSLQQTVKSPFTFSFGELAQVDWYRLMGIVVFFTLGVITYAIHQSGEFDFSFYRSEEPQNETISIAKEENFLAYDSVVNAETAYRFDYTSTGFHLKSLDFISHYQSEKLEKRFLNSLPKNLQARAAQYIRPILLLSQVHQIDPVWVMSVMWTESHFKPQARSHVGASGLMQVMPETRKYVYNKYRREGKFLVVEQDHFNIGDFFQKLPRGQEQIFKMKLVNMEIGILYLKRLLKAFNYNHRLATVSYNMGPGWTARRLRQKLPVGVRNVYLNKVVDAYKYIATRVVNYDVVAQTSL